MTEAPKAALHSGVICKLCKERGKDWNGDDPVCAFTGKFSENWNCATLDAIRDICYEGQPDMPAGVDYQYCEDCKYATIHTNDIEAVNGMALWVAWYKSRGRTDAIWVMSSEGQPRIPTEQELLAVIAYYKEKSTT